MWRNWKRNQHHPLPRISWIKAQHSTDSKSSPGSRNPPTNSANGSVKRLTRFTLWKSLINRVTCDTRASGPCSALHESCILCRICDTRDQGHAPFCTGRASFCTGRAFYIAYATQESRVVIRFAQVVLPFARLVLFIRTFDKREQASAKNPRPLGSAVTIF